jgi:hypothetical protein
MLGRDWIEHGFRLRAAYEPCLHGAATSEMSEMAGFFDSPVIFLAAQSKS